jgi:deoxyribonuclease (pyrimidine dimer)|tara:strand:+ start:312 stop:734 length:423 start_codon:yes stop_codon:yes gene_type:complete
MTRINIIDPCELSDQHLVAEYREIFHVGSAVQRAMQSPNKEKLLTDRPEEFTLGKGHTKFFYDKGKYLHNRYTQIVNEMKARGMKPDPSRYFKTHQFPDEFYNDWEPDDKAYEIIRERINLRLQQKPDWYRWTNGKSKDN